MYTHITSSSTSFNSTLLIFWPVHTPTYIHLVSWFFPVVQIFSEIPQQFEARLTMFQEEAQMGYEMQQIYNNLSWGVQPHLHCLQEWIAFLWAQSLTDIWTDIKKQWKRYYRVFTLLYLQPASLGKLLSALCHRDTKHMLCYKVSCHSMPCHSTSVSWHILEEKEQQAFICHSETFDK